MLSESLRWVKRRQQNAGKGTLEQDFIRVDLRFVQINKGGTAEA